MREVEFKPLMIDLVDHFNMLKLYHTLIVAGCGVYYFAVRTLRGLVKGVARFLIGGLVGAGRVFLDEIEKASTDVDALMQTVEVAEAAGLIYPVRVFLLLVLVVLITFSVPSQVLEQRRARWWGARNGDHPWAGYLLTCQDSEAVVER
jgi:hypothetical protein